MVPSRLPRLAALTLTTALLASGPVLAGSLPGGMPLPNFSLSPDHWGGVYDQIGLGGRFGHVEERDVNGTTAINGFTGSYGFGYGKQFNHVVLGVEADVMANSGDSSSTPPGQTASNKVSNPWLGALRMRLGYDVGRHFLPYIAGGLAVGQIKVQSTGPDSNGAETNYDKLASGLIVGAGVEVPFGAGSRWGMKAEYDFVRLSPADGYNNQGTLVATHFEENIGRILLVHRF
ncbi:hypothetical protein GALL_208100 [mine drainage metagenome]|uniref:Outer membrane protein beta-barrel domain-containing protein n=1 Tax=mine drainage metagenome TaxID=410659 RepID=A0A1J5RZB1_9ZZZZ